jgi:hypothetical protein
VQVLGCVDAGLLLLSESPVLHPVWGHYGVDGCSSLEGVETGQTKKKANLDVVGWNGCWCLSGKAGGTKNKQRCL